VGDADRIADLKRQLADANNHVAALTAALVTRRSACNEESERADAAERQLAEAREAASQCCDGYEGQISMLQAVLRDTQRELAEARAMLHEKSPPG
jgi:chromosome segregation ATPase